MQSWMMWTFGSSSGPYVALSWALPSSCRSCSASWQLSTPHAQASLTPEPRCHRLRACPAHPAQLEQRALIRSSRSSQSQIRSTSALVPSLALLTPQDLLTEKCERPSVPTCLKASSIRATNTMAHITARADKNRSTSLFLLTDQSYSAPASACHP